jgi:S-adenosylmethionine decarboxylase
MDVEFGVHQTFDCYNCNEEKLNDFDFVYNFLNELPGKIGMKKMTLPLVIRWPGECEKDPGGITGFVLIAESHISIHTFPKLGFFTMDIYSCSRFDTKYVKEVVKQSFDAKEIEENVVKRGLRFRELALSKIMCKKTA